MSSNALLWGPCSKTLPLTSSWMTTESTYPCNVLNKHALILVRVHEWQQTLVFFIAWHGSSGGIRTQASISINNKKKARIIKEAYTISPKELISTSQVKSSVQNAYEKIWITKDQQQNAKFAQTYLMCRNPSFVKNWMKSVTSLISEWNITSYILITSWNTISNKAPGSGYFLNIWSVWWISHNIREMQPSKIYPWKKLSFQ